MLAKEKTWKCIFNTNSELSQNGTEKEIMPSKTTVNWLFNNIGCYLFIGCFNSKIGVFQQSVVRVYYVLNRVEVNNADSQHRWVFVKYLCRVSYQSLQTFQLTAGLEFRYSFLMF